MAIEVRQSHEFEAWLRALHDVRAAKLVSLRIARIRFGHLGDAKFFDGIGELRIDHGPGYRIYFVQRGKVLVVLLCGGDKSSQSRDIKRAKKIAEDYR